MSFAKTFKLRHQVRGRDDAVRRLTLQEGELTLDSLRAKAASLFALKDNQVWYFKWTDTDGDLVTLTEEYEFDEMISARSDEAVLKLDIFVEPPTPIEIPIDVFFPRISPPQFNLFVAPQPECQPPRCQPQSQPRCHAAKPSFCARCDVTSALLVPGTGNWYHRPGTRSDLCADEFNKLNAEDQALFVLVSQPLDLGDDIQAYSAYRRRCHRFMSCNTKQEQQKQQDEQQQPKQAESCPNKAHPFFPPLFGQGPLSMEQLRKSVDSAVVATCDQTNQELRVGQGWYHKFGSNYDLCESAFNQLSDEDKGAYIRVESVEDLGEEVVRYLALPKPFQGLVQSFLGDLSNLGNLFASQQPTASTVDRTTSEASEALSSTTLPPAPVEPVQPRKQLHQLEIISGPSVVAGAKVKSGAHLFPVWEVKNAASSASNMWTDVRIRPTAENPFQISESGFEVPSLEAGASGLVSVDFIIPETLPSGPARGDFVFVDSDGDIFGQPLSLAVDIVRPEDEKSSALIRQLQDMGFSDEQACKEALAANNRDINGAALALLRAQRF